MTVVSGAEFKVVGKSGQLWTVEEPDRSRIARGLAWAEKTRPQETDLDTLMKRRSMGAGPSRGRRR